LEILLVGISVKLRREAVGQEHRRIILFETAEEIIQQLLRGQALVYTGAWIAFSESLSLIEGQECFEFFDNVH
jgi:hypothetical protein